MPSAADLRLAELLAARLCHELSGPIGAIGNGAELLSGEDAADFVADALALIGDSAARAVGRLQFYRFAYGFGRGGSRTGPAPHELAAAFFAGGRIDCDYRERAEPPSLDWHKLACNLLLAAAEGLPRGGRLVLSGGAGPAIEATGEGAALPPQTRAGLLRAAAPEALSTRTVHAYFTGLLAAELGWRLDCEDPEPGRFRLRSAPL